MTTGIYEIPDMSTEEGRAKVDAYEREKAERGFKTEVANVAWPDVIDEIEAAISRIQEIPKINVGFRVGYACGLSWAAARAKAITRDQYHDFTDRAYALYDSVLDGGRP